MLNRCLNARRIDQKYGKLVWSSVPNNDNIIDKKVIDIDALNYVPNMISAEYLMEGSLVKSYLQKREFEFPKLKQFYIPFVPPTGFLQFKCTTNLFDMEHPENNKCTMTIPLSKITNNETEQHILKLLAGPRLVETSIKIVCDRFPFYNQNKRWCMDKYNEMLRMVEHVKSSSELKAFLKTDIKINAKKLKYKEKREAKRYPQAWLVQVDPVELQALKAYGKPVEQVQQDAPVETATTDSNPEQEENK